MDRRLLWMCAAFLVFTRGGDLECRGQDDAFPVRSTNGTEAVSAAATPANGAEDRQPLTPENFYRAITKRFAQAFPREHLLRLAIDDVISAKTWTNYLEALDYDRIYFLQSDIAAFRKHETSLDDRLREGNLDFAYEVFGVFKERVRNRAEYVKPLLQRGFDLDEPETYRWKRKKMPWPADEAEWDELWRKRIKNEYIQQLIARELAADEEARKAEARGAVEDTPDKEETPEAIDDLKRLTPEEYISKRYEQFRIMLDDNDSEWVLQKYLTAVANAYDPHSSYMSESTVEDFDIQMKLSLVGIGALLSAEDGTAKVLRLIPGGPAALDTSAARLVPGDRIIAVGQEDEEPVDVLHWPLYRIVEKIRGKKGTRVTLVVVPASDPSGSAARRLSLVRDEVRLEEQAASWKLRQARDSNGAVRKLAFISLPAFYANMKASSPNDPDFRSSAHDLDKIIAEVREEGAEGIVLDLRNNGGGSLMESVTMTGLFVDGPVVQVREADGIRVYPDEDVPNVYTGPMVVLVNRLSASASEILAGALQDYGRALIVGDSRTHGKGTVQTVLSLSRNAKFGSMKITTAGYYRISGDSTQLKGVTPDIVVSSPYDYMDMGEDSLDNPIVCPPVNRLSFRQFLNLGEFSGRLRQSSEQRRAGDQFFTSYQKLLDRISVINRQEELPLQISERRQLARTEREFNDLTARIEEDAVDEGADKSDSSDLVAGEALCILADLVALTGGQTQTLPPPVAGGGAVPETENRIVLSLLRWLHALWPGMLVILAGIAVILYLSLKRKT